MTLLSKRTRAARGRYVYSEQEYLLTLETQQLGRGRERLVAVRGKIRNLRTGRETSFRLWLEDDSSIVPVRFEFQPRSFLRLTFRLPKPEFRPRNQAVPLGGDHDELIVYIYRSGGKSGANKPSTKRIATMNFTGRRITVIVDLTGHSHKLRIEREQL